MTPGRCGAAASENRQTPSARPATIAAMEKNDYRFVAIPSEFAASTRRSAAAGRPSVIPRRDAEPHQCRHCLTLSEPGETVLLASYCPFSSDQPYAERGPIFVHERECARYDRELEYPAQFPRRSAVIRAYDASDAMVAAEAVGDRRAESVIEKLFADPRVAYLHARNVAEGCFMFRIERKTC